MNSLTIHVWIGDQSVDGIPEPFIDGQYVLYCYPNARMVVAIPFGKSYHRDVLDRISESFNHDLPHSDMV